MKFGQLCRRTFLDALPGDVTAHSLCQLPAARLLDLRHRERSFGRIHLDAHAGAVTRDLGGFEAHRRRVRLVYLPYRLIGQLTGMATTHALKVVTRHDLRRLVIGVDPAHRVGADVTHATLAQLIRLGSGDQDRAGPIVRPGQPVDPHGDDLRDARKGFVSQRQERSVAQVLRTVAQRRENAIQLDARQPLDLSLNNALIGFCPAHPFEGIPNLAHSARLFSARSLVQEVDRPHKGGNRRS